MLPAERWRRFPESIFSSYSRQAHRLGAVNLAQGFPNFSGPELLISCMQQGLALSSNQYAPPRGDPDLRALLAQFVHDRLGICSRAEDFVITAGATEAIFSLVLGVVNQGDRVLVFEPYYESYCQSVAAAGGQFVPIRVLPPAGNLRSGSNGAMAAPSGCQDGASEPSNDASDTWEVDWQDFDAAASLPFRMVILNSPHNPTGIVFDHEALHRVLDAARKYNAAVVADEVYEELVFSGEGHVSILELAKPGDLVCRVSSVAKSFGFTGFKLGWIQGPEKLLAAALAAHEAILFCVAAHIQRGFALFLEANYQVAREEFLQNQSVEYLNRRNKIESGLLAAGFKLGRSVAGGYFVCANAQNIRLKNESDAQFADRMMHTARVAALPLSAFCVPTFQSPRPHPLHHQCWLRFAFCKTDSFIDQALENLSKLRNS